MSSPFTSKLGTNYCPRDEEITQIKTLLADPILRLKHLSKEILQKALDKLSEERVRLSAYVDAHRALISPVRRLQHDIVREIFIASLPSHRNCVMSAVEAPVLLGRICSSWRSIYLSTPRLWSSIHIVDPHFPHFPSQRPIFEEKLAQRLNTTKMWLARSGQRALSISLHAASSDSVDQFIRILLPFASRWQHITFATLSLSLATMSRLTEADVPMLKSVSIIEVRDPFHANHTVPWDSFRFLHCPAISSFRFHGRSFTSPELPLRWDGLTDLSISLFENLSITAELSLKIFSQCPQLRSCQLAVDRSFNILSGAGESVVELSFLHTLELQGGNSLLTVVFQLFSHSSFPQLRNFKLRGDISLGPKIPWPVAAPRLEKLDLKINQLFSRTYLADFLCGLPSTLRHLEFSQLHENMRVSEFSTLDDEVFESLIRAPDFAAPGPCSGLRVLKIMYPCSVSDDALLRFIQSQTLEHVVIDFTRDMQHIQPELQLWAQSALHLELTCRDPVVFHFPPWKGLADEPNFIEDN
ncbi:hypothetical protein FB451DRAFT_1570569 [Mycena latifolia]|nr:hypothetical protein FB451DRAFT_1570569 [Mycena latifolia]